MVLVLALSLVAIGCPPVEQPPPNDVVAPEPVVVHEWVVQSVFHPGMKVYAAFLEFVDHVYEMSEGRIVITPKPDGAIVGTFEVFEAARAGVIQGFHSFPVYWWGKDPGFGPLVGMVASFPECWMLEGWFWHGGGIELARELYAEWDLFFVGPQQCGPESIHFTERIDTVADMAGMLFRTPPGMSSDLFYALGAAVVILPGGEVYMALEKGLIEGAEFMPLSIMYDMGIHEVAPYFIVHSFHQPVMATELVVCMEAWEALDPDLQAIVEVANRAFSTNQQMLALIEMEAARAAMIEFGNTELFWGEECVARATEVAVGVWEKWAPKSPAATAIIESKKVFMRELGLIE